MPGGAGDRHRSRRQEKFFWRNNQQVLEVQQVSYSPPEKLFRARRRKKKKVKKGNGVENLLNLTDLLVFITGLDKDPGQKNVPYFGCIR